MSLKFFVGQRVRYKNFDGSILSCIYIITKFEKCDYKLCDRRLSCDGFAYYLKNVNEKHINEDIGVVICPVNWDKYNKCYNTIIPVTMSFIGEYLVEM